MGAPAGRPLGMLDGDSIALVVIQPEGLGMRVRVLACVLSWSVAVSASAHGGVVLCAKPRHDGSFGTTVKIRTAACGRGEQQLDPGPLGLQGPPGPSPGFTCTSACVSGYPTVRSSCGGQPTPVCGHAPATSSVRTLSCVSSDALQLPFCLVSDCEAGPCPGEPTTPACAPDASGVTWTISGHLTPACWDQAVGDYTCQITGPTGVCLWQKCVDISCASWPFNVTVSGGATPEMQITLPRAYGCPGPLLLGPGNTRVDAVPITNADVRYTAGGNFDFTGCNCTGSGYFSAVGTCP